MGERRGMIERGGQVPVNPPPPVRSQSAPPAPPRAENADRLEAMAAPFGPDAAKINAAVDGITPNDPDRDMAAAAVVYVDLLREVQAELDRLRVIVDLACAEHEARERYEYADGVGVSGGYPPWLAAREACDEAVVAEVTRRAAL